VVTEGLVKVRLLRGKAADAKKRLAPRLKARKPKAYLEHFLSKGKRGSPMVSKLRNTCGREISSYIEDDLDPGVAGLASRSIWAHCRHCAAVLDSTRNILYLIADEAHVRVTLGVQQALACST